jgi:hypothetical protein
MQNPVKGDIYHIAERVREAYPDLFLCWNAEEQRYEIMREHQTVYGDRPQLVMTWDKPLDGRLIHHLRATDMSKAGRSIVRELREARYEKQRRQEREQAEMRREMSKTAKWFVDRDTGFNRIYSTAG